MAKILITTIQVNLCCLIPYSGQNSSELLLLKLLPSTYTITVISWPPPLISQLYSLIGLHLFKPQGCF